MERALGNTINAPFGEDFFKTKKDAAGSASKEEPQTPSADMSIDAAPDRRQRRANTRLDPGRGRCNQTTAPCPNQCGNAAPIRPLPQGSQAVQKHQRGPLPKVTLRCEDPHVASAQYGNRHPDCTASAVSAEKSLQTDAWSATEKSAQAQRQQDRSRTACQRFLWSHPRTAIASGQSTCGPDQVTHRQSIDLPGLARLDC
jgi:hypothetical protein